MNQWDDLTLWTRIVMAHDDRAFEKLVQKYQSEVRRFFLHQTMGDEMLSDDLAQETFITVYTHISGFRNLSNFKTWLYRIAYNVFLMHIRSQKTTVGLEAVSIATQTDSTIRMDIYRALQELSPPERTCVTLSVVDDLPIAKIVVITGMPEGTVKSHISRGKEKLANYLKMNGYEDRR
ncbi:MAG: RNA polymerase sigma factor [Bacteroidaceae bacterium]|nr:RNA polymerase sigma factor [Bacteroidaceae bacterium]MCF0186166.1 RNA polymerase sigma factor [Bacteroidaceae bacterium]